MNRKQFSATISVNNQPCIFDSKQKVFRQNKFLKFVNSILQKFGSDPAVNVPSALLPFIHKKKLQKSSLISPRLCKCISSQLFFIANPLSLNLTIIYLNSKRSNHYLNQQCSRSCLTISKIAQQSAKRSASISKVSNVKL